VLVELVVVVEIRLVVVGVVTVVEDADVVEETDEIDEEDDGFAFTSRRISSVAFSASINVEMTGKAPGTAGNADPSTTLNRRTPRTLNCPSRTACGSLSAPILHELVA
jgi:hypothetical protein